mmetsp:Transcript_33338/g.78735  ORF Transcript_33338/g.78735 Transcript_33338/m.78735 type:complete len:202 (+) Transcript_33338:180-785(+)
MEVGAPGGLLTPCTPRPLPSGQIVAVGTWPLDRVTRRACRWRAFASTTALSTRLASSSREVSPPSPMSRHAPSTSCCRRPRASPSSTRPPNRRPLASSTSASGGGTAVSKWRRRTRRRRASFACSTHSTTRRAPSSPSLFGTHPVPARRPTPTAGRPPVAASAPSTPLRCAPRPWRRRELAARRRRSSSLITPIWWVRRRL